MKSKSAICKIGKNIRESNYLPNNELLDQLEDYRISYKDTIATIYAQVNNCGRSVFKNSIATYRMKRIDSIIRKLKRLSRMQLDRMWDVAGCRCILNTNKQVYEIRSKLYACLNIIKEYDYIKKPRQSGYQSIHLFAKGENGLVVEIQIRNKQSHNWATLVEISDYLFDDRIKENQSNSDF